jgi:enoyl-CoA hydratase/carnithine racemase
VSDVVEYETADGVATITLNRPDQRNALHAEANHEMAAVFDAFEADPKARVAIVTGAGDKAFSAGGDLASGFIDAPLATHGDRGALADLVRTMRRCGKPVIARVNGHALAGGFGLAAACDIVIAVEGATFGAPEVKVGLWPMMISAVLQRLVPQRVAFDLMATGRRIDAHEAQRIGVVSRVVATEELDAAVDETVAALVAISPAMLALGKQAFYAVEDMPLDAALDHLQTGLTAVAMTEDGPEGITAFLEKRDPVWKGR